ncbi:DUF3987 domain-containing protein [Variovorax humicola]|uniref:DUF3987 domain-containing protein n=1 Tax=Variovorax humicola TaxID=1769758 RepID=A0ABU8W6F0_9BURK
MTSKITLVSTQEIEQSLNEAEREEMDAIVDPRDDNLLAPSYGTGPDQLPGLMPKVYEDFIRDRCHLWGCDPALYTAPFLAVHAGCLHSSVRVQTNPHVPNSDVNIADFALLVGGTGVNKSGPHKDLMVFIKGEDKVLQISEELELQKDTKRVYKKTYWISTASIEMLVQQQSENRGFPLNVATDEFYNFLNGAVTHHAKNGYTDLSEFLNTLFDGGSYKKKLKDKGNPEVYAASLHTSMLCATTIDRLKLWEHFEMALVDGFLGRLTISVGTRANTWPANPRMSVPGAEPAFHAVLKEMLGLRDYVLVLDDSVRTRWIAFVNKKLEQNLELERDRKFGLLAWNSKYEKRLMRLAAVFQLYKYIEGGKLDHRDLEIVDKVDGRRKRRVLIRLETMLEAVAFHEQVLLKQQEYFHEVSILQNDFHEPTLHLFWKILARGLTEVKRDDLVGSSGHRMFRGHTKDKEALRNRFINFLFNMGFIKMSPNARNSGIASRTEYTRFDIPKGFLVKFRDAIPEAKGEYEALLARMPSARPLEF